ncbi:MAG: methyltransferase domain-containing protein [Candidatus Melainabacteria bacterium]|nr:methyltransferase domain-containing protein [Candidatus Melainabacteria bacterium]
MGTANSTESEVPFVTYYKENRISPVAQDVSDLRKHFQRREGLYRQLGIPSALVRERSVIEFGPGSGHNSIYTLSLSPGRYVLVDGNPSGLESVKSLLLPLPGSERIEIIQSLIEDFDSAEKFDFVFCEGVIPFQIDPSSFAKHVSSFVRDRGVLVITCTDAVALAPEVIRKLCAALVVDRSQPIEDRIAQLLPIFSPHLLTMKGMSRFHRDWILDVLLHDWVGPVFSIAEAVETLSPNFHAYGLSPGLATDWRWYKDIYGDQFFSNEWTLHSYLANVHNFIDYRTVNAPRTPAENEELIKVCQSLFDLTYRTREKEFDKQSLVKDLQDHIERLSSISGSFSSGTSRSLDDCKSALVDFQKSGKFGDFGEFGSLWGRGQQYLSFLRADGR